MWDAIWDGGVTGMVLRTEGGCGVVVGVASAAWCGEVAVVASAAGDGGGGNESADAALAVAGVASAAGDGGNESATDVAAVGPAGLSGRAAAAAAAAVAAAFGCQKHNMIQHRLTRSTCCGQ